MFTDTDSLFFEIKREDVYLDLLGDNEDRKVFDNRNSNYDKYNKCFF